MLKTENKYLYDILLSVLEGNGELSLQVLNAIEDWLPSEKSFSDFMTVEAVLMKEGYNACLDQIKSKLKEQQFQKLCHD